MAYESKLSVYFSLKTVAQGLNPYETTWLFYFLSSFYNQVNLSLSHGCTRWHLEILIREFHQIVHWEPQWHLNGIMCFVVFVNLILDWLISGRDQFSSERLNNTINLIYELVFFNAFAFSYSEANMLVIVLGCEATYYKIRGIAWAKGMISWLALYFFFVPWLCLTFWTRQGSALPLVSKPIVWISRLASHQVERWYFKFP